MPFYNIAPVLSSNFRGHIMFFLSQNPFHLENQSHTQQKNHFSIKSRFRLCMHTPITSTHDVDLPSYTNTTITTGIPMRVYTGFQYD